MTTIIANNTEYKELDLSGKTPLQLHSMKEQIQYEAKWEKFKAIAIGAGTFLASAAVVGVVVFLASTVAGIFSYIFKGAISLSFYYQFSEIMSGFFLNNTVGLSLLSMAAGVGIGAIAIKAFNSISWHWNKGQHLDQQAMMVQQQIIDIAQTSTAE